MKNNRIKIINHKNSALPRVVVFRSNRQFYAQVIEENSGKVLASASTLKITDAKSINEKIKASGLSLADDLKKAKLTEVVFDRNCYKYHGQVKLFADTLREAGVKL